MTTEGLNRDFNPLNQPENSYRHALNGVISKELGSIISEEGNIKVTSIPFNIVGKQFIDNNRIILFLTDETNSEIGLFDGNQYKTLFSDTALNFSKDFPIDTVFDSSDNSVYFTDNSNPVRKIEVEKTYSSVDELNIFFSSATFPTLTVNTISQSGGSLKSGEYTIFIKLFIGDSVASDYIQLSEKSVFDNKIKKGAFFFSTDSLLSNNRIDITISNIDTTVFDSYELVVVRRTEGVVDSPRVFGTFQANQQTRNHLITSIENKSTKALDEIVIDPIQITKSKSIDILQNKLWLANYETHKEDIGYQKFANNIKVHLVTKDIPFANGGNDTSFDEAFRSVNRSFTIASKNKTYKSGDVYAFYISFVLKSGKETVKYFISGQPVTENDASITNTNILTNAPGAKQFHFDPGKNSTTGMGYWENQDEFYPDGEDWKIFDVDTSGNPVEIGTLEGQKVRYHQFPLPSTYMFSNTYHNATYKVSGIELRDVKIPDSMLSDIIGIKIYRADKKDTDKTVLAQSIMVPEDIDIPKNATYIPDRYLSKHTTGVVDTTLTKKPVFYSLDLYNENENNLNRVTHIRKRAQLKGHAHVRRPDADKDYAFLDLRKRPVVPTALITDQEFSVIIDMDVAIDPNKDVLSVYDFTFNENNLTLQATVQNPTSGVSADGDIIIQGLADSIIRISDMGGAAIDTVGAAIRDAINNSGTTKVSATYDNINNILTFTVDEIQSSKVTQSLLGITNIESGKTSTELSTTDQEVTAKKSSGLIIGELLESDSFDKMMEDADIKRITWDTSGNIVEDFTAGTVELQWLVDMMVFNPNLYLGEQILVFTGFYSTDIEALNPQNSTAFTGTLGPVFGGDTYLVNQGLRSYQIHDDLSQRDIAVVYYPCESYINWEHRRKGNAFGQIFFPGQDYEDWWTLEDAEPDSNNPNYIDFLEEFSFDEDIKPSFPFTIDDKPDIEFPFSLAASQKGDFNTFLIQDSTTISKDHGQIIKVKALRENFIIHFTDVSFISRTGGELAVGNKKAFLGSGNIFEVPPVVLSTDEGNYGGLFSNDSSILTNQGYFFVDPSSGRIFVFGEQLQELNTGLRDYFQNNLHFKVISFGASLNDLPKDHFNCRIGYDPSLDSKRILISCTQKAPTQTFLDAVQNEFITDGSQVLTSVRWSEQLKAFESTDGTTVTELAWTDTNWFEQRSFTLSFDIDLGKWISFHSYFPDNYLRLSNSFFSVKTNSIWKHNEGARGSFYGQVSPFEFESVFNRDPATNKLILNIRILADILNSQGNSVNDFFDYLRVFTQKQDTGLVNLITYPNIGSNVRDVEGDWLFNKVRDISNPDGSVDSTKNWYEKRLFISKFVRIFVQYTGTNVIKLHNITSNFKPSIRQ